MGYILLGIAIVFELIATTCLKYSDGFTKLMPSIGSIVSYSICFYAFAKSLQSVNLSIAYASWSVVGIIVSALLSVFIFKENITITGIAGIVLILIGVILLNLFGTVK